MARKGKVPMVVLTGEQIAQVKALSAYLSVEDIAGYLKIGPTCFREIRKRQPEVDEAYRQGVAEARSFVASKLMGYLKEKDNSSTKLQAIMFYLKTQGGWREKQDVNVSNEDGTLKNVTPTVPTVYVHYGKKET